MKYKKITILQPIGSIFKKYAEQHDDRIIEQASQAINEYIDLKGIIKKKKTPRSFSEIFINFNQNFDIVLMKIKNNRKEYAKDRREDLILLDAIEDHKIDNSVYMFLHIDLELYKKAKKVLAEDEPLNHFFTKCVLFRMTKPDSLYEEPLYKEYLIEYLKNENLKAKVDWEDIKDISSKEMKHFVSFDNIKRIGNQFTNDEEDDL